MNLANGLITAVCILCLSGDVRTAENIVTRQGVPELWTKPGTEWVVRVQRYTRGWMLKSTNREIMEKTQKPMIGCEFHVSIRVLDPQGEGEQRTARIQFSALDDAPDYAKGIFVLEIDASTGAPKTLKEVAGTIGGNHSIAEFDGKRAFFSDSPGFPMCWVVGMGDLAQIPPRDEERRPIPEKAITSFVKVLRPAVSDTDKARALEVEAALFYPLIDVAQIRVIQTWVPGEGWWRRYTRYIQGHLDLEATLVERRDGKKE